MDGSGQGDNTSNAEDTNSKNRKRKNGCGKSVNAEKKADHTSSNSAARSKVGSAELEPPKRFLTAYNFFFMHERAAFLEAQSAKKNASDGVNCESKLTAVKSEAIDTEEKPWTQKKKKRQHVKTPGMIGFTSLVKLVAAKWKDISPDERKVYDEMAKEDLARYRKELQEYKAKVRLAEEEAKKEESNSGASSSQKEQPAPDNVLSNQGMPIQGASSAPDPTSDSPSLLPNSNGSSQQKRDSNLNSPEINNHELKTSIMSMDLVQPPRPSQPEANGSDSFSVPAENEITLSDSEDDNDVNDDLASTAINTIAMDSFTMGSFSLMSLTTDDIDNIDDVTVSSVIYESQTTRIIRMSNSQNKFGGGSGFVALKVLIDQFPDGAHIARLENEFKVLQHISECKYSRAAFQQTRHDGLCAMCLEWVEGETLREWIKSTYGNVEDAATEGNAMSNRAPEHETAVGLAWEITKAISQVHDSGVIHNNISSDNIIVDVDSETGTFSVKIIDFGRATMLTEQNQTYDTRRDDLYSLGAVFFELFSGKRLDLSNTHVNESESSSPEGKSAKSNGGDQQVHNAANSPQQEDLCSFLKSRVPLSMYSLVFNLLERNVENYHYKSASDVDQDIYVMLTDPENYLFDTADEKNRGQLNFPTDKLFGRTEQISEIVDAYNRVIGADGLPELVLVSGHSGAGKSALVHMAQKSFDNRKGFFLHGKFDQLQQVEPLSAIVAAFSGFCHEVVERGEAILHQIRSAIRQEIGSETGFLIKLIPSLRDIIDVPESDTVQIGAREAQNRVKNVFRMFVRAIATTDRPLVLFLDDLQWADPVSIEVMKSLAMDAEKQSFLLIGSYQNNKVSELHLLRKAMRDIEKSNTAITKIKVGKLRRDDTNSLVSVMLQTSTQLVRPLADIIHRKTGGNALFVLQFVRSLFEEGLLRFSFDTKRWVWDVATIESIITADDALDLIVQKILKLPREIQTVLKMMACLGSHCDETTLRLIAENNNAREVNTDGIAGGSMCYKYDDLVGSLELAVNAGLLNFVSTKYKFSHDQIQLAAYNIIPENERGLWHLQIGNWIWTRKDGEPEKVLFLAVVQLNLGSMFINEKDQKIELARLNFNAGESAKSFVAYPLAASYLKAGIKLLDEKCWEEHYDLSLRLHECYAEAEYCNGKYEEMEKAINRIFAHAICFEDQLRAYFIQIWALGAREKMKKAVEVGIHILSKLGEPFPITDVSEDMILSEFSKTKKMLEEKTDEDLLELNPLINDKKIAAMQIMSIIAFFANLTKRKVASLIVLRSIQISLSHGICKESLISFSSYSVLLVGSFGDIEGAYRFGKLSIRLLEKSQAKEISHRVISTVYGLVNSWVEHHHTSLKPLENAYHDGMRYGDVQWAFTSIQQYCAHSYHCGKDLPSVEKDLRKYENHMKEYRQTTILKYSLPYRQVILNLMGLSSNPLQLTGDAMNQEQLIRAALETKHLNLIFLIFSQCSVIAYMFGDNDTAAEMADKAEYIVERSNSPTYSICSHTYYYGLITVLMARKSKDEKWKKLAKKAIEKMNVWAEYAPSNCEHKLLLLQAEHAFLLGETENATKMYNSAIEKAGENGFIQEQAIGFERAGIFYFEMGNVSKASLYYGKAHSSYLKWGARGKADHLLRDCPF